jgi:hypothetical protein
MGRGGKLGASTEFAVLLAVIEIAPGPRGTLKSKFISRWLHLRASRYCQSVFRKHKPLTARASIRFQIARDSRGGQQLPWVETLCGLIPPPTELFGSLD